MAENISVREWKNNYLNGEYEGKDFHTQVKAGWYDWFCKDTALSNRLKKFGRIIAKVDNPIILDNYYVWFKNNCPCVGPLYDDMRFEPLDEGLRDDLYFGIAVDDKREDHKYQVFTARNGYETEFEFDDARQVVRFLNGWTI